MLAAINDRKEVIKYLLSQGANPDTLGKHEDGMSAVHLAAQYGSLESLQILLKDGAADVYQRSLKDGAMALHYACEMGYTDIVHLLLGYVETEVDIADNVSCNNLIVCLLWFTTLVYVFLWRFCFFLL